MDTNDKYYYDPVEHKFVKNPNAHDSSIEFKKIGENRFLLNKIPETPYIFVSFIRQPNKLSEVSNDN